MFAAKRYLRLAGGLLGAITTAWVVYRVIESGVIERAFQPPYGAELASRLAVAIPVYALGVAVLSLAWCFVLASFSPARIDRFQTITLYAVTQFGKYFPGGVVHYVGRHAALRQQGHSHGALVYSAVAEAGLLVAAALLWGCWLMPWAWGPGLVVAGLVLCIGGLTGFAALRHRWTWLRQHVDRFSPRWLLAALAAYVAFFGIMGFTLILLRPAGWQGGSLLLVGAAAMSWVAGYVVIGAPAGLGVREAAFLALLGAHMPNDQILLLVAAFRLATFGGDLLAFLLALPLVVRQGMQRAVPSE